MRIVDICVCKVDIDERTVDLLVDIDERTVDIYVCKIDIYVRTVHI